MGLKTLQKADENRTFIIGKSFNWRIIDRSLVYILYWTRRCFNSKPRTHLIIEHNCSTNSLYCAFTARTHHTLNDILVTIIMIPIISQYFTRHPKRAGMHYKATENPKTNTIIGLLSQFF
jgi:hypothetical protein